VYSLTVVLQIVPMQAIVDSAPSAARSQLLKNLSFSVYANCRQSVSRSAALSRSLTGFGPTAGAKKVLHSAAAGSDIALFSVPPFVLAPPRETVSSSLLDPIDHSNVLLCAYCLSADQRWLLASCTDSYGEQVETTCINIEVPMRSRRRVFSVRRTALMKLWDFLLGVMGQTTTPWRVVIGRFGRLGHGELKGTFDLYGLCGHDIIIVKSK
jgi:mediator of RNA polymerase II transcription subunit 13